MSSDTSATGADFSETVDVCFHSIAYLITVSTVNGDTLCLEVEQKSDASRWKGDFTARYIEDITAKTGNFKKFHVFVKMLLSAVKHASDSVFMDLLTYQDLEVLKTRKAAPGGQHNPQAPPPRNLTVAPNNKRYLILTYAAEFDRVHYPLPLLYDEHPDPQHLKSIIGKLRSEVDALQQQVEQGMSRGGRPAEAAVPAELRRLREDNAVLKQQLRQLERWGGGGLQGGGLEVKEMARDLRVLQKERDLVHAQAESLEAELQRERGLHRRELRKKSKEIQEAFEELAQSREQIRELKLHVRQLMEELDASSRHQSSADRIRSTYGRPPGIRPRPSVPSGARFGTSTRHEPIPRSRDTSRGRETSSRERERIPGRYPPSRPSSAPDARSGPRFDPTEYVRAKRERDRMLLERARSSPGSSRNLTPQRSAASTPPRSYSPVPSRPRSAERGGNVRGGAGGGYSPTSRGGYSPSSSRPTSGLDRGAARPDRLRAGAGITGAPFHQPYVDPLVLPKSRAGSPSSVGLGSRRPAWGGSGSDSGSKLPPGSGGQSKTRPVSAERSTSPGRALQEVKDRLSSYMTSCSSSDNQPPNLPPIHQSASTHSVPSTVTSQPLPQRQLGHPPQIFDDATTEIADIDTRLHALQNFLKMAKSSGGRAAS